ncbi:hypothetical protein HDU76_014023, partial [Blyttiomyces sp. JEL0837]
PRKATQPLAGGYRRIPVLQIGADIYCDTGLILEELERRFPENSLIPLDASGKPDPLLGQAFKMWGDKYFSPAAGLLPFELLPKEFTKDRTQMFNMTPDLEASKKRRPFLRDQVNVYLTHLEQSLANSSTPYLLSQKTPTWADVHASMNVWFASIVLMPEAKTWVNNENFPRVMKWLDLLMEKCPGGKRGMMKGSLGDLSEDKALEIARSCKGKSVLDVQSQLVKDTEGKKYLVPGRKIGDLVAVTPEDYGKVDVVGKVVSISVERVAVRQVDSVANVETVVHFPRQGYIVKPAQAAKI